MKTAFFVGLLAVALCSCQTSRPLIDPAASTPPVLAKKGDLILFECTFFTVPDNFELLKNTKDLHVAGVFSPQDGDRLLRELKSRRRFEVTSAPSVTTRQGQKGEIEIIRELIYPVEFDPPKIGETKATDISSFPVTPTTPTKFETKNVGITAGFKGRRTREGAIDFDFNLEQTNFLGFINYGSPITTFGRVTRVVLTENRIEQPVFTTKRISSTVTLKNGHYVAVGGMRADTQKAIDDRSIPGLPGGIEIEEDKNLFAMIKVTAVDPE